MHNSLALYGPSSPLAGQSTVLAPGEAQNGTSTYTWGAGPYNIVLVIWAQGGAFFPKLQYAVSRIPIIRDGFAQPNVIQVPAPVYIGLWNNPAELFNVWRANHEVTWLTVAGHIVNLRLYDTIQVSSLHLTIRLDGVVLLSKELDGGFYNSTTGNRLLRNEDGVLELHETLSRFVYGLELVGMPADLSRATLKLVLTYKRFVSGWQSGKAICVTRLKRMGAAVLRPPLKSPSSRSWRWGNGPDHDTPDAHCVSGERYCYDCLVVSADGKTYSGDCTSHPDGTHSGACVNNESFFAYGAPVFAAANGTVRLAEDGHDENAGVDPKKGGMANFVILEHDDGSLSGYFHLRKGTVTVVPGQYIAAGRDIGQTGNSGNSSEPHLHFGYIRLHETGRGVIAPVAFSNMKAISGSVVNCVPGSGQYKS